MFTEKTYIQTLFCFIFLPRPPSPQKKNKKTKTSFSQHDAFFFLSRTHHTCYVNMSTQRRKRVLWTHRPFFYDCCCKCNCEPGFWGDDCSIETSINPLNPTYTEGKETINVDCKFIAEELFTADLNFKMNNVTYNMDELSAINGFDA